MIDLSPDVVITNNVASKIHPFRRGEVIAGITALRESIIFSPQGEVKGTIT